MGLTIEMGIAIDSTMPGYSNEVSFGRLWSLVCAGAKRKVSLKSARKKNIYIRVILSFF